MHVNAALPFSSSGRRGDSGADASLSATFVHLTLVSAVEGICFQ